MAIDSRFFISTGPKTLAQLAELTGGTLAGEGAMDIEIAGVASTSAGQVGDIAFCGKSGFIETLNPSLSACIIPPDLLERMPAGLPLLIHEYPRFALAQISSVLYEAREFANGGPLIDPTAKLHEGVRVHPGAVIGSDAAIGENTVIGANAVIGPGVQIGRNCQIGASTSIFFALLGNGVKLSAGVRIGEAGFGTMDGPEGVEDTPHFGRVILQDLVTIGANTTVDRGVFDDTIVGERTKMDNLIQIAHNVTIGRGVLMAAYCGLAGSAKVGDFAKLGGRVGVMDHIKIGEQSVVAAHSGTFRNIPDGEFWGGAPAKPVKTWMKEIAWVSRNAAKPKKKS